MKKLFSPKALKQNQDLIREAHLQLSRNRITRRDFLKFASAMGAGAFGMQLLSPLGQTRARGAAQDATPVRGGTIYSALGIDTRRFDDPAKMDQVFVSNYVRQVCDYLVVLDPDLILQPALATSWTPSADGLDWTITLREGVKFNHGKDFNADDVVFTFSRLIDPETASGWAGAANYVTGVEKIDDFTVVFHTNRVVADFPYTLFLYHAAILPADWPGDFFTNPWGTGPFTIEEHVPDEFVRFRRREDYWQMGADGLPLPYVDAVEFVSYPDEAARFSALQEGSLDLAPASITLRDQYLTLSNYDFSTVQTGNLHIGIMQFNQDPWTNPLAVQALKLSIDRKAYAETLFLGLAIEGDDHPIAPGIYPLAPTNQTPLAQDYEQAKALLAEAGYPDGLDLTAGYIDPASDGGFADNFAQFLVGQLEPAGIRLTLAPNPDFWTTWLDDWGPNQIAVSNWAQKNTASEMFNLAYYSTGVWNESHWNNPEFDALLEQFDRELDQEARVGQLETLTNLVADQGTVLIPGFRQDAATIAKRIHYRMHPQAYVWMGDAWVIS